MSARLLCIPYRCSHQVRKVLKCPRILIRYQIEPLKLETLDGNFKFSAMVQQIADKQAEQAQKIEELLNKLKTFEDAGVPLPLNAE